MNKEINEKQSFLKKQFDSCVTYNQIIFDGLFGVVLPVLCLVLDPFIFNDNLFLRSPIGQFRVFAYTGICFGILALVIRLILGTRLNDNGNGFFVGVLFFGAFFSFVLGIALIPFSFLALLVSEKIGILGFTPLATGFVYLRNGYRSLNNRKQDQPEKKMFFWGYAVSGLLIILAIPIFSQLQTSRFVSEGVKLVLSDKVVEVDSGVRILKKAFWCNLTCYNDIVNAYQNEKDDNHRAILANAYKELTGLRIEVIIHNMMD